MKLAMISCRMWSTTEWISSKGYEDWLRHKADNEVNGAPVFVVRSGSLVQTRSKNIRVRWHKWHCKGTLSFKFKASLFVKEQDITSTKAKGENLYVEVPKNSFLQLTANSPN